jgi:1-phosphofructokinase
VQDIDELMKKLDAVKSGDFLVLAGSIPNGLPDDIYEQILSTLADRGVNFVVDATGELLMNVLKYKPFLVKPNHHELGDMFGVETKTDSEIEFYAKKLQEMGARNVLVSRAKDGAMLVDENGDVHKVGNAPGKLVNSVGCGDSMVAGFVAGYIQKGDYHYALNLGSACGNATAFSMELATKDEIINVLNKYFSS